MNMIAPFRYVSYERWDRTTELQAELRLVVGDEGKGAGHKDGHR